MAVHQLGGESVQVTTASRYYWFHRRQGVAIEISLSRNWWCLWLCSNTKKVERIECAIVLSGITANAEASGSCNNCGSLKVWGPSYWGLGVPAAYQQARYRGTVRIKGQGYAFEGVVIFT
jgi:hypothetical protein